MLLLILKYHFPLSSPPIDLILVQSAFEAEQSGFSAAREELATTRERLRRLQEDDLAVAMSDLAVARDEARTIAAVRDSLERRLGEESRTLRTIEEALSVARREAEAAQNEVVELKKEAEAREAKASVDLAEVMAAKEESSAVAKKSEEERDAAQREVNALTAQLLEAQAGREASEEALNVARGESSSLSKQLHAAGEEVRTWGGRETWNQAGEVGWALRMLSVTRKTEKLISLCCSVHDIV